MKYSIQNVWHRAARKFEEREYWEGRRAEANIKQHIYSTLLARAFQLKTASKNATAAHESPIAQNTVQSSQTLSLRPTMRRPLQKLLAALLASPASLRVRQSAVQRTRKWTKSGRHSSPFQHCNHSRVLMRSDKVPFPDLPTLRKSITTLSSATLLKLAYPAQAFESYKTHLCPHHRHTPTHALPVQRRWPEIVQLTGSSTRPVSTYESLARPFSLTAPYRYAQAVAVYIDWQPGAKGDFDVAVVGQKPPLTGPSQCTLATVSECTASARQTQSESCHCICHRRCPAVCDIGELCHAHAVRPQRSTSTMQLLSNCHGRSCLRYS